MIGVQAEEGNKVLPILRPHPYSGAPSPPSLAMIATITSPAIGSAHHHPPKAPAKKAAAKKTGGKGPQKKAKAPEQATPAAQ